MTPTEFVGLEGRFHATSLDGQPLPQTKRVLVLNPPGAAPDTITYLVTEITWRFHDSVENPELWDYVDRTEAHDLRGAEEGAYKWTMIWRYRATADSLWLRFVDHEFQIDTVMWRVPWDAFDAAFQYRTVLFEEPYQYVARFERVTPSP